MKTTKTPEEYYSRRGCEHTVLKFIFLIVMIFLFSCEKPKEICWTCTTIKKAVVSNETVPWEIEKTFETCDEGVKLLWDGKEEIKGNYQGLNLIMYKTSCK